MCLLSVEMPASSVWSCIQVPSPQSAFSTVGGRDRRLGGSPRLRLISPLHAHLNGRYGDPVWPLAPLTGNPSTRKPSIYWEHWPAGFRDEMRLAAWNLINGQLRPTFLRGHSRRMRGRPGMTEVNGTLAQWRQLARWLEERGIRSLAGCDAGVLDDYGQHLRDSGQSRKRSWCPWWR
jgi:hypothetical protein